MMQIGGSGECAKLAGKPPEVEGAETLLFRSLFLCCGDKAA